MNHPSLPDFNWRLSSILQVKGSQLTCKVPDIPKPTMQFVLEHFMFEREWLVRGIAAAELHWTSYVQTLPTSDIARVEKLVTMSGWLKSPNGKTNTCLWFHTHAGAHNLESRHNSWRLQSLHWGLRNVLIVPGNLQICSCSQARVFPTLANAAAKYCSIQDGRPCNFHSEIWPRGVVNHLTSTTSATLSAGLNPSLLLSKAYPFRICSQRLTKATIPTNTCQGRFHMNWHM